ncbi:MAG: hypothetical protein LBG96_01890 [Tannerella sp.]|nr:hypothetical protein [Tannerella sp.]
MVYSFEQLIIRIHPEAVRAFRGLNQNGLVCGVNADYAPGQFQGFLFHATPPSSTHLKLLVILSTPHETGIYHHVVLGYFLIDVPIRSYSPAGGKLQMFRINDLGNLDVHLVKAFGFLTNDRQGWGTAVVQAEGLFYHAAPPSLSCGSFLIRLSKDR